MNLPSPFEEIVFPANGRFRLFLKRDDLIHPEIQGNKWRKLSPYLPSLSGTGQGAISFGGPYSNHLHALAAAGKLWNFSTIGIVRGAAANEANPTLTDARAWGMKLFPVPKGDYDRLKKAALPEIFQYLGYQPSGEYLLLPEGADDPQSLVACRQIAVEIREQLPEDAAGPVYICVPAGTGCTAGGIAAGSKGRAKMLVFPAAPYGVDESMIKMKLKAAGEPEDVDIQIITGRNPRKFAQMDDALLAFVRQFRDKTGVLLDPIYTSKMMLGIQELADEGYFPAGSCVVAVLTGGLQGWRGIQGGLAWFSLE